jgi:flagellar hook-length control protein FliK
LQHAHGKNLDTPAAPMNSATAGTKDVDAAADAKTDAVASALADASSTQADGVDAKTIDTTAKGGKKDTRRAGDATTAVSAEASALAGQAAMNPATASQAKEKLTTEDSSGIAAGVQSKFKDATGTGKNSDKDDAADKGDDLATGTTGTNILADAIATDKTDNIAAGSGLSATAHNPNSSDFAAAMNLNGVSGQRSSAGAASVASATIETPVGSEGWGEAIGNQMIVMHGKDQQQAELHLNPADLGPIKVSLTIADNQAQATFTTAHESVRAALQEAMPQLKAALADNGIQLNNASVSADSGQQQAFAGSQAGQSDSGRRQNASSNGSSGVGAVDGGVDAGPVSSQRVSVSQLRTAAGRLDTFA